MSEPFLAEVKIFPFTFAPKGWAFCDGQILPINQNQALYSLLGTTYGGDGRTNFALPDLRGRVPIHFDGQYPLGNRGGEATHTLTTNEIPSHTHAAHPGGGGPSELPTNNFWGTVSSLAQYRTASDTQMNPTALALTGGSQGHENRQPFLALNFAIALVGLFPSRS